MTGAALIQNEIDPMRSVEAVCPRPAKRGEGKGEGSGVIVGPLSCRAFGSSASPPIGGEAKKFLRRVMRLVGILEGLG
jgi:hypothetical protein